MLKYHELVNQHFFNPCNVGEFAATATQVKTAKSGSCASGAVIQLQLMINDQLVIDTKFKAYGCVATIASCSWLTEFIKGKSLQEVKTIDSELIMMTLQLPLLKRHRIILLIETLKKTLEDLC